MSKRPQGRRLVRIADHQRLLRERRELRDEVRQLRRDVDALKRQRAATAAAVRELLNVAHDDDTDEVPF